MENTPNPGHKCLGAGTFKLTIMSSAVTHDDTYYHIVGMIKVCHYLAFTVHEYQCQVNVALELGLKCLTLHITFYI